MIAYVKHQDGTGKVENIDRIVTVEGVGLLGKIAGTNYGVCYTPGFDAWIAISSSERFTFETSSTVKIEGLLAETVIDRKLLRGGVAARTTQGARLVYKPFGATAYVTAFPLTVHNEYRVLGHC